MSANQLELWLTRSFFLTLFLLLGLSLLVLNGRWLLSEAYAAYAIERLHYLRYDQAVLKSAELATSLLDSDENKHALYGGLLPSARQPDAALAEYGLALRAAPADPSLWQGFVRLKLTLSQFDPELEHAMHRVRALAPRALALHADNAYLALQYWHWATPSMRKLWADSVRYTLDHDPKPFMKLVMLARKEDVLCVVPELRHPNNQWWCKVASQSREKCFAPIPSNTVLAWCQKIGLVQDPLK